MLLEPATESDNGAGFIDFLGEIDGSGGEYLKMPAGGSRMPATCETVTKRLHYVHQDGAQVFKYAVRKMYEVSRDLLERNGFTANDLSVMIPHQANRRIIEGAASRLGLSPDKVLINIDRYGNTSAASVAIALDEARKTGACGKGDWIIMVAFGSGLTWAGATVKL